MREQEVLSVFFGVRPLFNQGSDARQMSRDFHIEESPEGVYTIIGGKLTTARLMAEKASDVICEKMGKKAECTTHEEKLPKV